MSISFRYIPGTTLFGKVRGGGSERIEWARNGPLLLTRTNTIFQPGFPLTDYYSGGAIFAATPTLPTLVPYTDNTVKSMGDSAISMARPMSPSVNILTSAGEIAADGLPTPPDLLRWRKTLSELLATGADAARDYVAWNFAWKPLESEVRTYYKRVVTTDSILQRAKGPDKSRIIRVGHHYPTETNNWSIAGGVNAYGWVSGSPLGNIARGGLSYLTESRVWYEGKYLYVLPMPKEALKASRGYSDFAKHVLGLELTPEVLWNLTPWSWFADWMTNTDVIMSNISSMLSDGLVLVDAFVMHHSRREVTRSASGPHMSGDGKIARFSPAATRVLNETKKRFPSVPYLGFGGTGELTARQISILAALGISRA